MNKITNLQVILICCTALLCGCKTNEVATDINVVNKTHSELSEYHEVAKIDTTRVRYSDVLNQVISIDETITIKEYDENGVLSKETKTKRKIIQGANQVASKEEAKGESVVTNDSTHHVADVSNMVDSKTEEESIGGQESFGKWLGIIIGTAIVVGCIALFIYLRKKLRVSKNLL